MNIELLKAFHRQSRIETDCPPVYLPLSACIYLAQAAQAVRAQWDPSHTNTADISETKTLVRKAFGQVLMYFRDVDLDEVSKAIPTWVELAKKAGDPSKLIADAFMDAMNVILTESSGPYKASSIFGVLCAVLDMSPDGLVS